jgi:hypothetical protein
MIHFDPANSEFFTANKNYCERIEQIFKAMNVECSGTCSSFGYDLKSTLMKNNRKYTMTFHKHQSTQNGVVIPVNAVNYSGTEVLVENVSGKYNVAIGKSAFKRFFTSHDMKNRLPSPFYAKMNFTPDRKFIDTLLEKIKTEQISDFNLRGGSLVCKMHIATEDPQRLIDDLDVIIKHLPGEK